MGWTELIQTICRPRCIVIVCGTLLLGSMIMTWRFSRMPMAGISESAHNQHGRGGAEQRPAATVVVIPATWSAEIKKNPFLRPAIMDEPKPVEPAASVPAAPVGPLPIDGFRVDAISYREGSSIAIINGQVRHEGDMIGDVRIRRIDRRSIVLERGAQIAVVEVGGTTDARKSEPGR